nr:MAG TPA: Protein of unknown function (DUF983) [Caudoviricetes sp.]
MYPMRTHCPVCGHLTARTSYSDAREYAHGLSVANGTGPAVSSFTPRATTLTVSPRSCDTSSYPKLNGMPVSPS